MPSPVPERNRNVYFSEPDSRAALGMPNTAALITDVKRELGWDAWRHSAGLDDDLIRAFQAFYPDGGDTGFTPDAVDFFRSCTAMSRSVLGFQGACQKLPTFSVVSSSESPTSWSSV